MMTISEILKHCNKFISPSKLEYIDGEIKIDGKVFADNIFNSNLLITFISGVIVGYEIKKSKGVFNNIPKEYCKSCGENNWLYLYPDGREKYCNSCGAEG